MKARNSKTHPVAAAQHNQTSSGRKNAVLSALIDEGRASPSVPLEELDARLGPLMAVNGEVEPSEPAATITRRPETFPGWKRPSAIRS